MHFHRIAILTLVIGLTVVSSVAARTSGFWTSPGQTATWHYSDQGGANILSEEAGVAGWVDPTEPVSAGDMPAGTRVRPYEVIDLLPAGVPRTAKAVQLNVKTIITKGPIDNATSVFAFARRYGSKCCGGPAGMERYPIDWNATINGRIHYVYGWAGQSVAQLARDSRRDWNTVIVPVSNGRIEFAWGYRKAEGDAVGVGVMLTGWLG